MAVAVYWDFENVHAALVDGQEGPGSYRVSRYKSQPKLLEIARVMEYVAALGDVFINKAYANWQWFSRYRDDLLMHSVDLIQLFPRGLNAKNGSDIRLSLDVLEDCLRFGHVQHVMIIGGDSDYISLAQKVQQLGKRVTAIGVDGATNDYWIKSVNEFKFYHALVAKQAMDASAPSPVAVQRDPDEAKSILLRTLRALTIERNEQWVNKAAVRPTIKRLDPSFDEGSYGFENFNAMITAFADIILTRKGPHDQQLALSDKGLGSAPRSEQTTGGTPESLHARYTQLLKHHGIALSGALWRRSALEVLHSLLTTPDSSSPIRTWAILDARLAEGIGKRTQVEASVVLARQFRHLAYLAGLVRLRPEGIVLTSQYSMTDMEAAIARLVVLRLMQNPDDVPDTIALRDLLYDRSGEPPFDLAVLVADVGRSMEIVDQQTPTSALAPVGNGNGQV
jgi:hypothetical protein